MKPLAIGRAAARAVFHGGARMVAQSGKTQQLLMRAAVAPVAWKSKLSFRALAAVAEHHRGRPAFVETNLGIADGIRALIPVGKSDLIFGRPHDNLAERATLDLVSLLARHSGAFVDVGANEGLFTFLVATDPCRPVSTSVHFFEPDAELFPRLAENMKRSNIPAIANNVALSDHVGVQTFYRNLDSDLSGSLTTHFVDLHATAKTEVQTTTLSAYLLQNDLRNACVKVDVEGAGTAVWSGVRDEIARIDWLVMEVIGPEAKQNLPNRIIRESGFFAYYMRDFDLMHSSAGEYEYRHPFYNWLFCRRGPAELASFLAGTRFRVLPQAASGARAA